ncbi:beta-ketoacyl synthase [Pyrenophora seminiperda CCB06]|uniref:Beta-ketoacyl synthase n=1 Tax=Pyrenophora seminiperda CCB06 TaxID=1302712 RepID=A0A3M7M9G1_9PLEO|nr:beta-ketoacyl synthase [Pyrenophora seminiperda CCB06]
MVKNTYGPNDVARPLEIAKQSLLIGAASALPGTAYGALFGTLRTRTPVLFSIVSGAQWFAIGTTFWAFRTSTLNHTGLRNWWNISRGLPIIPRDDLDPTPSDKVRASVIAGGLTGFSLGFLFRGPQNVIPGTIMFSLFGWAGQHGYHYLDTRNSQNLRQQAEADANGEDKRKGTIMYKLSQYRWSPMRALSDDEYANIMQEKLLNIEAQIAIIDDKIEAQRKQAAEMKAQQKMQDMEKQVQAQK